MAPKPPRLQMVSVLFFLAVLAAGIGLVGCGRKHPAAPPEKQVEKEEAAAKFPTAVIKTEHGDITIRLLPDAAPKTVANFVALAKEGYFDGITWHRVVADYVIQSGDPTGTGEGGKTADGKPLPDEICAEALGLDTTLVRDAESLSFLREYYGKGYNVDVDQWLDRPLKEFYESLGFTYTPGLKTRKALKGMVGMAHSGPGTATSQFFIITHKPQPHLDGTFTFFAEVTAGLDVAQKIKQGEKIETISIVEE